MTMTGSIKHYLHQKKFGFILGDDNKDYFFHENALIHPSQVSQIVDGALVEFDPTVSPKGYKATKVSIKSMAAVAKFIVPDAIVTSKTDTVNGWEIPKSVNGLSQQVTRVIRECRSTVKFGKEYRSKRSDLHDLSQVNWVSRKLPIYSS